MHTQTGNPIELLYHTFIDEDPRILRLLALKFVSSDETWPENLTVAFCKWADRHAAANQELLVEEQPLCAWTILRICEVTQPMGAHFFSSSKGSQRTHRSEKFTKFSRGIFGNVVLKR